MSIYCNSYELMHQCLVILLFNKPEITCSHVAHQERISEMPAPVQGSLHLLKKCPLKEQNFIESL